MRQRFYMKNTAAFKTGYSDVNGIKMYYEVHGQGQPFVLIHGGGSTLQTSFGNIIPHLAKNRQLIAMDLQAHGRTDDRDNPLSFRQDADDVVALLKNLGIQKADFLGFSNGGHTTIEIALHYPAVINRLIIASAFYKRSGTAPQFWDGFDHATLDDMPQPLKDGFLAVNNDPVKLVNMFNKDVQKMKSFKGWTDGQMKLITAPVLIMNSAMDVGSPEHAVEMYRIISNAELVILPGRHGEYLGTIELLENGKWEQDYVVEIIENFLNENDQDS